VPLNKVIILFGWALQHFILKVGDKLTINWKSVGCGCSSRRRSRRRRSREISGSSSSSRYSITTSTCISADYARGRLFTKHFVTCQNLGIIERNEI